MTEWERPDLKAIYVKSKCILISNILDGDNSVDYCKGINANLFNGRIQMQTTGQGGDR